MATRLARLQSPSTARVVSASSGPRVSARVHNVSIPRPPRYSFCRAESSTKCVRGFAVRARLRDVTLRRVPMDPVLL